MPILRVDMNVPTSKITPEVIKSTSRLVAELLEKPEERVIVHLNGDQKIIFGGSGDKPCGFGTLSSIGKISHEENKKYSKGLCAHFEQQLGIPQDRIYFQFIDVLPTHLGHNGTTKA